MCSVLGIIFLVLLGIALVSSLISIVAIVLTNSDLHELERLLK